MRNLLYYNDFRKLRLIGNELDLDEKSTSVLSGTETESPKGSNNEIWAIAGGKGGTGKTMISANIAIGMAVMGYKVIVIDADLGVPNLHNYFGIKKPDLTIDDFLTKKVKDLSDLAIETPSENLRFISGGTSLVGVANLQYAKKQKLLRHISELDAEIIIVDLGAGISHNTIDFFNLSQRGIVITNPEPNATQDAYFFLKNAAYRRLKQYAKEHDNFKESLDSYVETNGNGTFDFKHFYEFLPTYSSDVNKEFRSFMSGFKPRLIVNKARSFGHRKKSNWFINMVEKFLSIDMDYLGAVSFDKKIVESSMKSFPVICRYPKSRVTKSVYNLLDKMVGFDLDHNDVTSFRQFSKKLKELSKKWD